MKFDAINPGVIEQFRAGQEIEGLPGVSRENHILLTTLGRKSGQRRTIPLRVFHQEGDRIVVVAGNGGESTHPAWYHNILANPQVTVEDHEQTYQAVASVITGEEWESLWKYFDEQHAGLSEYLAGAGRVIPVVALTRT
jgi:deazaflavin-dependent oxidoreductase (nitroreductase family)